MISYPPHLLPSSSSPPMDTNRPSPRQLQGPRPAPLKVRKESYKINKKPPAVPQNPNQALPQQQQRPPVIIYTVSPKIIHTNPSDFMTLVQRLTGPDDSLHSPAAAPALSPAARFAAIENADRFSPRRNNNYNSNTIINNVDDDLLYMGGGGGGGGTTAAAVCSNQPGILSPMPSSLQPIPPSFFSPISSYDPGSFAFLHDLSPGPNAGAGFLFSPHNLLATPTVPSPGALWDLFNQL
ncbi:nuclear speckle RNA-binding protein B-like [Iris pallida]|uniref:Nuclear speckle RNA-binding protein B-like n=1 Tax=Iris pallida TaxID=29817 RepID=A0AAX6IJB0_IRIPA|nr:nuclear speckle RNA-binding protein B-like [Iris pallida]